jgi:GR25 family glycosyltransferase involved in LPS biosynthesis
MSNIQYIIDNYKVKTINISFTPQNNINNYVNKIFIINLCFNKTRRNYILMLMKKYKISFTLVVVDKISDDVYQTLNYNKKLTKSEIGCTLSHLWCLNKIIKNKYPNAIIFEDDIIFHKDFDLKFYNIMTSEYDFLLLGACDFSFSRVNYKNVKNNLYRPSQNAVKVYGAHAIYYSLKGAQKMFDLSIQNIYFFDRNYHPIFEYFPESSFICYPNLVVTDISTTNLGHSYSYFTEMEKYYYNSCFIDFEFNQYNFIYLDIIIKNKSVDITDHEDYQSFIKKIIKNIFDKEWERKEIQNRLVMDFFTIEDIQDIL